MDNQDHDNFELAIELDLKNNSCFEILKPLAPRNAEFKGKEISVGQIYTYDSLTILGIDIRKMIREKFIKLTDKKPNITWKEFIPKKEKEHYVLKINNYIDNVKKFYCDNPFFYDKNKIFWYWNKEDTKWQIVDEIDIMNSIDKELGFGGQTVTAGIRSNYLESFKRVGRLQMPKEAPKHWIQFKNKAYSLRSGNIYSITSDYLFCNPIPWEIGETDETPTMDKLFEEWVGKECIHTLYEIIAYCCYADYPIHTLFCFIGSGRNGKTQFQRLLTKFIGNENTCSTELDVLLDSRFESVKLYKKLVCSLGETNFGIITKTSLLKKLTGQDLIGFEFKNKMPFDHYNYAKIIINSNSLPSSEDTSEGFYRRWLIVDFPNQFKEGKDIINTIPDIEFNNLAKKITKILTNLIKNGKFSNQGTIEQRKHKYIMASNPLPYFIEHCCYQSSTTYMRYSEFYTLYTKFLNKAKKRIVSKKEFSKILTAEGYESRKTSKDGNIDYYIEGLQIKEDFLDFLDFHKFSLGFTYKEKELEIYGNQGNQGKPKNQHIVYEQDIHTRCCVCDSTPCQGWYKSKPICQKCINQINELEINIKSEVD